MKKNILIWICMFCLLCTSVFAVLNDAEVYYSFDDDDLVGNVITDLSTNNRDGNNSGATTGITGINDEGFSCDGTDDIVYSAGVSGLTDMTISLWFKQTGTDYPEVVFASKDYGNPGEFIFRLDDGTPGQMLYIIHSVTNLESTTPYNDGEWHNMIYMYDSSLQNHSMYIDNVSKDYINSDPPGIHINSSPTFCSSYLGTSLGEVDIDEFGIWGRLLLEEEIQSLGKGTNPYEDSPTTEPRLPKVNLMSPLDNGSNSSFNINFKYNYTTTTDSNLSTTYLYTNQSGVWQVEDIHYFRSGIEKEQIVSNYATNNNWGTEANIYDGLTNTYSSANALTTASLYWNITKLNGSIRDSSRLEVWWLDGGVGVEQGINYTIPKTCWDYKYDKVITVANLTDLSSPPSADSLTLFCYDGSDWETIGSPGIGGQGSLNELFMWVNTSSTNSTDNFNLTFEKDTEIVWNVLATDNNSNSSYATSNNTFYVDTVGLNYTYAISSLELQEETFTLKLNSTVGISLSSASFSYAGTYYTPSKTSQDDYDLYSVTLTVPSGEGTNSFTWGYNITTDLGYDIYKTLDLQQSVGGVHIDNCTDYDIVAINFSFIQDSNNIPMTGSMDGYFQIWINSQNSYKEFNLSWVDKFNPLICIDNSSNNYSVYAQFEYTANLTDYAKKTYYFYNVELDNQTDYINLYFTPNSTQVEFEVTDENDDAIENAYIHILKYDLGTNSHTTNSILKTDTDGKDYGEMLLFTTWYKFFVYKDGELFLETEPTKIITTSKKFRISLTSSYSQSYSQLNQMISSLTFNNITKNFVYTFSNPTGLPKEFCLKVTKRNVTRDVTFNTTCTSSTSGTLLVNIGAVPGEGIYLAYGTISGSPTLSDQFYELKISEEAWKAYGQDGIFMTFFIKVAFAMIGIWNPIVAILMIVLADITMFTMGIYHLSWSVLMVYVIMAIIVGWKISRR